jgi:hypothetical protein
MRIYDNLTLFNEMFGSQLVTFSMVSHTGQRKTFQVKRADPRGTGFGWFVSQLTGPDNRLSYTYLCMLQARGKDDVPTIKLTAKSPIAAFDHEGVAAFNWLFRNAISDLDKLNQCQLWKACNCRRCGKLLTVPSSIEAQIGPTCRDLE